MNDAHKIAVFGKDVHILYVVDISANARMLLYLLTFEKPKNLRLPDVTFNELRFSQM